MRTVIFDIETGPLPESELTAMMPTEWPIGNVKDPDKVKAAVEAKRKAWLEDAALDPLTGRVLAVGMIEDNMFSFIDDNNEAGLLANFWKTISHPSSGIVRIVGFNCNTFDLPFLVRRSWKHNIPIAPGLREGRYWAKEVHDLRESWQLGDRQAAGSLDSIAKHLGVGAKSGSGKDFAALWASDRAKALAYLENDLRLTEKIAQRLGVL
jgi:DNA polymerase elongation subunit (family B)